MIATLLPSELRSPPPGPPRSHGIHQSKVVRAIAAESGILDAKWVEDLSLVDRSSAGWWESLSTGSQLRMAIGMAWEEWYLPQLPGVIKHPGEMELDGIYMTHDGEELSAFITTLGDGTVGYELLIHECKTTSKSVRTVAPRLLEEDPIQRAALPPDLASQFMWLAQTKAYCKAAGALSCILHVLFLYGDYKRPYEPQLKIWRIDYSQEEIDQSWQLLLDYVEHRKVLAAEGGEPL